MLLGASIDISMRLLAHFSQKAHMPATSWVDAIHIVAFVANRLSAPNLQGSSFLKNCFRDLLITIFLKFLVMIVIQIFQLLLLINWHEDQPIVFSLARPPIIKDTNVLIPLRDVFT